jgi:plastocyanin
VVHADLRRGRGRRAGRALRVAAVAGLAASPAGLAACGSSGYGLGPAPSAPASSVAAGDRVTIRNFSFSPTPLQAKTGSTITIVNGDQTTHTFTADDHSFDSGHIAGGASATVLVTHPGRYAYHCDIHNYMQGVVQVAG